jgi:hypothetical protein
MGEKVYWIEREGRWVSVFITTPDLPKTQLGDIIGEIYNMRRRDSHKRLRLCWRNLLERSVNEYKGMEMWPKSLEERYEGPFKVDWKY